MTIGERLIRYYTQIAVEPSMLFENIIYSVCVVILLRTTRKTAKDILLFVAHTAALWAVLTVVGGFFNLLSTLNRNISFLGNVFVLALYAVFFCKYRWGTKLVYCMTFFSAERCINAVIGLIPLLLRGVSGGEIIDIVLRNVLVALTLGLPIFLKRFGWHRLGTVNAGSVIFMTLYSALSITAAMSCIAFKSFFGTESIIFALIVLIGFIGTELFGHWLVYHLQMTNAENLKLLYINYERESNEELLSMTDKNLEELRKIRHDTKNWIANMRILLENGKYDELRKFFGSVEKRISASMLAADCGNKSLNAIFDLEARKARDMGVKLDTKAAVPPELPFPDSDMCSLITNLIDNAFEGTVRCGDTDEAVKVGVLLAPDNYLYITVTNPVNNNEDKSRLFSLRTTKKDAMLHGYGTKITDDIVRRYNGAIVRDVRDGKYFVDVMLDTMWNKGKENTGHDKNQRCGVRR